MLLDTMNKNIRDILNTSTIKFIKKAKALETTESKLKADEYIAAKMGLDTFRDYPLFDEDILESVGFTYPLYDIPAMVNDKTLIPQHRREEVLIAQRNKVINEYIELNDYYRELMGLPHNNDTDFVYLTDDEYAMYGITNNTPIHLISSELIYQLENDDIIKSIKAKNPDKKYLNYLGYHAIDPLYAREAQNFELLKVEAELSDTFYGTFIRIYNECREYVSTELYIPTYASNYKLYDNFMALLIMVMTIQRIISNAFRFGIQREFYDWSFIQSMYQMYNIPFIEDLSMEYHIIILKNLNRLLRLRSTDKVLLDVCELLGNEQLNIFRFYMIKQHRLSEDEKPIFVYKPVETEDGTLLELDKERTYDIYFQAVNIKETNIPLALSNKYNRKEYSEMIENDPYWVDDDNIKKIMYDTDYNYTETKYIGLNIMYRMTKMIFEITYINRMIVDAREKIDNITILLPKVYTEKEFRLFDIIIFMSCLICKKNGYETAIIDTPSQISHVMGFNFTPENLNLIRNIIIKNSKVISPSLLDNVTNLKFETSEDVNRTFSLLKGLYNEVVDGMYNATTLWEYDVYKDIMNIIQITENEEAIFNIPGETSEDDHVATTYDEYLEYSSPILYNILQNTEASKTSAILDHVISKVSEELPSLNYLYAMNDTSNSPLFTAITSLLRFFKSFSVDLSDFNITYIFDSKYFNTVKSIHHISSIVGEAKVSDIINTTVSDDVYKFSVTHRENDTIEAYDSQRLTSKSKVNETTPFKKENIKIVWDD